MSWGNIREILIKSIALCMHVRTIVGQPAFLYSIAGLRVCQKDNSQTYPQTIQCYLLIVCAPKVTLLRPIGKNVSGVAVVRLLSRRFKKPPSTAARAPRRDFSRVSLALPGASWAPWGSLASVLLGAKPKTEAWRQVATLAISLHLGQTCGRHI